MTEQQIMAKSLKIRKTKASRVKVVKKARFERKKHLIGQNVTMKEPLTAVHKVTKQ